jgi:hypothetical protein
VGKSRSISRLRLRRRDLAGSSTSVIWCDNPASLKCLDFLEFCTKLRSLDLRRCSRESRSHWHSAPSERVRPPATSTREVEGSGGREGEADHR